MQEYIKKIINDSIEVKKKMLDANTGDIAAVAESIISAYRNGRQVVLFGNGGSAADAQHFAAELVVRFEKNRRALRAFALTVDTSALTAIMNDFGADKVFSRQVEACVSEGDVVIAITTSGNSPNVIEAVKQAKQQKALVAGFTGEKGGKLKGLADRCICIPSDVTARIQEGHVTAIHAICGLVEAGI